MKRYRKIIYVFVIILVAVLSVIVYRNISKGSEQNPKDRAFSEVEYVETKLVDLLNKLNNIEVRNYNISISDISEQENQENNSNTSQGASSGGSQENSQNNTTSQNQQETGKKYDLIPGGILTTSEQIDWTDIKGEIEILYSTIPTITIDLYNMNINQDDILGFNKEFDNLTAIAKDEDKEQTLLQLSKLYEYIPKFLQNTTDNEVYKTTITAKLNILKAYSKLSSGNWQEISNDVKQGVDVYSKILTDTNVDTSKQQNIGKIYVMLGELQSAANAKNESAFLIKYKNTLEEMNNV